MDYIETVTCKRVQKVFEKDNLQANSIYLELKKYNETFMEQIAEAQDTETLLQVWDQMKAKSFLNYSVDLQEFQESLDGLSSWILKSRKKFFASCWTKTNCT